MSYSEKLRQVMNMRVNAREKEGRSALFNDTLNILLWLTWHLNV